MCIKIWVRKFLITIKKLMCCYFNVKLLNSIKYLKSYKKLKIDRHYPKSYNLEIFGYIFQVTYNFNPEY